MKHYEIRRLLYSYEQCKKDRDALYDEIGMVRARLATCYGGCQGGSADDIHVINGAVSDSVCNVVFSQIIPEQEHLERLLKRLAGKEAVIMKVERYLDMLDSVERDIVEMKYFMKMSWEDIIISWQFSRSTAFRIHDSALKKSVCFETN